MQALQLGRLTCPRPWACHAELQQPRTGFLQFSHKACLVLVFLDGKLDVANLHGQLLELLLPVHVPLLKLWPGHLCVLPATGAGQRAAK